MKYFISCDWGTSSFRLRLVETATRIVFAQIRSPHGIAAIHSAWKEQGEPDRFTFYQAFLSAQLSSLQKQSDKLLFDIPLVISGMAASSAGMYELPYKQLPVETMATELITHVIPGTDSFPYKMIFVSGLRSSNDVMRGEETILAGCSIQPSEEEQLVVLPGTHSKHVTMQQGSIKGFNTYMTGEIFDLLGNKSLLAASVEKEIPATNHAEYFQKGVQDATTGNFLNNIFRVRTNTLLNSFDKTKNYMYLSGLVIGEELKYIHKDQYESINLVSSGALMDLYSSAFAAIGLEPKLSVLDAEKALIEGQAVILEHIQ